MSTPNTKRLVFLTAFTYPTRYAHPIHGLQMARAWAQLLGDSFLFIVGSAEPMSLAGIAYQELFGGVKRHIPRMRLRTAFFALWFPWFVYFRCSSDTIVFVNDIRIALVVALVRRVRTFRFVFESHGTYGAVAERAVYSSADTVVFVTNGLRERASTAFPRLNMRSVVVSNAVDVDRFESVPDDRVALRHQLGLSEEGFLIGYLGRFSPGGIDKGISFMLRALPSLPPKCRMLFVGGTKEEITLAEEKAREGGVSARVSFVPFVEGGQLPLYAKACDALAYVPSDVGGVFHRVETSPMKLFEYMAARRPFLVSDTPSIRELVDESCAYVSEPDSVVSFVAAVAALRADDSREKIDTAYTRVRENTWRNRASKILAFAHK